MVEGFEATCIFYIILTLDIFSYINNDNEYLKFLLSDNMIMIVFDYKL